MTTKFTRPTEAPYDHRPLSHLNDHGFLHYVDEIRLYFHQISVNANTDSQITAMNSIKERVEWLQDRLKVFESKFNTEMLNAEELSIHLNNLIARMPTIKVEGPAPEMFIVEQESVGRPYVRRFINFDWIEWFLATRRNVTPSDAYNEAKQVLRKEMFRETFPMDVTISVIEGTRNPEIIVERTKKIRI